MGITFAQPQPLNPAISQAAGAAEVSTRNNSTLAGLYEAEARIAAQTLQQNRALSIQQNEALGRVSAQAASQRAQQSNIGQTQENQYREQIGQEQMRENQQAQEVQARLQTESNLVGERARAAVWANQQELSQAETLRLQRLQGQVDYVMSADIFTPDQKADLITQLRTGIDPLKQKLERTQAKRQQQQEQQLMQRNALIEAMRGEDRAAATAAAQKLYFQIPGRDTDADGNPLYYQADDKGMVVPVEEHKSAKSVAAKAVKPFDAARAMKDAQAEADVAYPPQTDSLTGRTVRSEQNQLYMQNLWRQRRADHLALSGGGQPQGPQGPQQPGTRPQPAFNLGDDFEKWAPEQGRQVEAWQEVGRQVNRLRGLTQEQLVMYDQQVKTGMQLLARYGSVERMPPAEQQLYERIKQSLRGVTAPKPPQPQQDTGPRGLWMEGMPTY